MLVFPDYDVKNGVPLEFAFDATTTALIDEYIYQHRPQLMRGFAHDWLFAGEAQGPKTTKTLSEQISDRLWKELGLEVTPHQFRHAAAYIILKADPGNYELVRRVLGHRSITTTHNFYIGLETLEATRLFGEMVTGLEHGEVPVKLPRRKATHA
jgi:site-specific recombinase XerD